jgi:hypothetical protein
LSRSRDHSRASLVAGAFAVSEIKEWISQVTEGAEQIERSAAKLGVSTDDVQQIGAIAKLTGSDFDRMSLQLERMQLQLAHAG